jgi:hypothetical protein
MRQSAGHTKPWSAAHRALLRGPVQHVPHDFSPGVRMSRPVFMRRVFNAINSAAGMQGAIAFAEHYSASQNYQAIVTACR